LLRSLFRNPRCGIAAREEAIRLFGEVLQRGEGLQSQVLDSIPRAQNLYEVLLPRLAARRALRLGEDVAALLENCGIQDITPPRAADLDFPSLDRIETFRAAQVAAIRTEGGSGWRLRHRLHSLQQIDRLLGGRRPETVVSIDTMRKRLDREDHRQVEQLRSRLLITPADGGIELASLVGTKSANLGEIARILGSEWVPRWFTVSDAGFRLLLNKPAGKAAGEIGLDPAPEMTLHEAIQQVLQGGMDPARKSVAIRRLWQGAEVPPELAREVERAYENLGLEDDEPSKESFVAIRSSAFEEDTEGGSWAGQFDTFLFLHGTASILEHLKLAMAGLWTERAIVHRQFHGAGHLAGGGGIIVQRMVRSRISGVLFTAAASTEQPLEMVINVGLGLGEGVVSGTVEVDQVHVSKEHGVDPPRFRYTVGDKRERIVFDARSGSGTRKEETLYHQRLRPALEYADLVDLVQAATRLEDAYGHPLDVEFAFEGDSLQVLQARPIAVFERSLLETLHDQPLAGPETGQEETS
jgi:hypothetical protein